MAPIEQGPFGPTSNIASARYRVLIPAQQLLRMGHATQIAVLPTGETGVPKGLADVPCDVMVLSKSYHASHLGLVEAMQGRGVVVAADFCDDHFDHPQFGAHFHALAGMADRLIASTPAMAEAIRRHVSREAAVVTDPVEAPKGIARFAPRFPALRIAWFGHSLSLDGVVARRAQLHALAAHYPVELALVTSPIDAGGRAITALAHPRVRVQAIPWSTAATWKALEDADLAWIPIADSPLKQVKSPNRLVEALWCGRLVIADALPAYEPFADLVPIGTGLEAGVMGALERPALVEERLREAQKRIARRHSGFECARQWEAALGNAAPAPLRLNLGCGDKILAGYVNVDVVEARAGVRPDVICDLHDLAPFADASADEILSVHVVEHFWRWEIADVLREWVRVLKPGGRMIVECPNIQSACQTFLENPVEYAHEDQRGQRTMWVFYGDPKWNDPLMIHRWGYTPESLRELLSEVGLRDVRQEPAQFKLREPRDMRVVGVKP
ncbi:MAG TPA: methyltransferase domain-containing protein [Usitatibacter sp.]|nr:methyltransferase domain-containing protein [Usitatibacter sp.]